MGVRRTEKDREKTSLGEHCFPAKSVEGLADVDEREVNHPEQCPRAYRHDESERFRPARDSEERQRDTAPDRRRDEAIRATNVKQARCVAKRDLTQKAPHRLQPPFAE